MSHHYFAKSFSATDLYILKVLLDTEVIKVDLLYSCFLPQ